MGVVVKLSETETMEFDAGTNLSAIKKFVDRKKEPEAKKEEAVEKDDEPENDDVVVKALAKLVADEQNKREEASEKFTNAIGNLDATKSIDELCGLIDSLISETKRSRKASLENTEAVVSMLGEVAKEMKLARTTPFEITVDKNGVKTMSRVT